MASARTVVSRIRSPKMVRRSKAATRAVTAKSATYCIHPNLSSLAIDGRTRTGPSGTLAVRSSVKARGVVPSSATGSKVELLGTVASMSHTGA